jgi:steroid delta-isomerase-like uncharacterized protein
MASVEQNKETIKRFYAEVIGQGRPEVVDELMAHDFVHHGDALFPYIGGSDAIKAGVMGVKNAYPDGHTDVVDMVGEGDVVVARLEWHGTHLGPFMGAQPSGQVHHWAGISTYRFNDDGKIIERWANQDVMGQLQDLGLIPRLDPHVPGGEEHKAS